MSELKPCPFCGGEAEFYMAGDNKQYVVVSCSKCGRTPVHFSEARYTKWGARRIWNKRCMEQEASE